MLALLNDPARVSAIAAEYARIHAGLRHDAAREAALAVLELIGRSSVLKEKTFSRQ